MLLLPQRLKFKANSPFKPKSAGPERTPLIWDRIDRRIRAGRPNVVLIEGGGQCGKSTLGMWICQHYDPEFKAVYSTRALMELMRERVAAFAAGDRSMLWKWIFFDELQSEALKVQWHNQRNIVIGQIVGMWGELKQNLVITCPDIDDIAPRLFRNIAVRMIVDAEWKGDHIQRTAFLFKPKKDIQKKGYKWGAAGMFAIPDNARPDNYLGAKMDNMKEKFERFTADLDRQDRKLYGPGSQRPPEFIPPTLTEERRAELDKKIAEWDKPRPADIPPPISKERYAEICAKLGIEPE